MRGAAIFSIAPFLGAFVTAQNLHDIENYEKQFTLWQQQFNVKFQDEQEYATRLKIFIATSDLIEKHNSETSTFKLGHNAYSHLTTEEFADRMRLEPLDVIQLKANSGLIHQSPSNISVTPSSWDWSEKGAVTGVKNQGDCS